MVQRKLFITGAGGFIGQQVLDKLHWWQEKFTVTARHTSSSFSNYTTVKDIITSVYPDIVIHLGSSHNTNLIGKDDPSVGDNVKTTELLLEACTHLDKPVQFIYISSATVYSDKELEVGARPSSELKPNSIYGLGKVLCENMVKRYAEVCPNIIPTILRPVATVGIGATHGLLPTLISKCAELEVIKYGHELGKAPLQLLGRPPYGSLKAYIHVDELATCILNSIGTGSYGTYNISPRDGISVAAIARMALSRMGLDNPINFTPTWPEDNNVVLVDNYNTPDIMKPHLSSRGAIEKAIEELMH